MNDIIARLRHSPVPDLLANMEHDHVSPYYTSVETPVDREVEIDGRPTLMFGANNYLGLANDPRVIEYATRSVETFGSATTGSRLLNGTMPLHTELENTLAEWTGFDAALSYTSGYTANVGCISALVGSDDCVVVDEYAHASIADGIRLSRAEARRFRHNDIEHLREVLTDATNSFANVLVIVDTLYSMEGSLAPLRDISALCDKTGALLMVDEAHSLGVYGERRTGLSELTDVLDGVGVFMASLSKGVGSNGGFIAGSADLIQGLRGSARSLLFSTSASIASVAASQRAIEIIRSNEGRERAERVLALSRTLRDLLGEKGIAVSAGSSGTDSPIVPIPVANERVAVEAWNTLKQVGIYVGLAIYPAVPKESAMLRICLSADHEKDDLEVLVSHLGRVLEGSRAA